MNISGILRHRRAESGLGQKEVANLIGIPRPRYAKYEEGRATPSIITLRKLATLYGYQKIEDWINLTAIVHA
jgi:transcriptional regulator with XRE-family HTH domain